MNSVSPLVCNMGVFTPAQRESHIQQTTELIQSVQRVQEAESISSILVVDCESADRSLSAVEELFPEVRRLSVPNLGYGAAANAGVAAVEQASAFGAAMYATVAAGVPAIETAAGGKVDATGLLRISSDGRFYSRQVVLKVLNSTGKSGCRHRLK